MKTKVLFTEVQKQNQKWIWFLLIVITLVTFWGIVQQIFFNIPFGNHPIPNWGLLVMTGVPILILVMLFSTRLFTKITNSGISYQFKPFHKNSKIIEWREVNSCYVRIYAPIKEYGGWGVRTAFNGKNGKAFNVSGNIGIQLELKNGKKILIGTQKPKDVEKILEIIKKGI